MKTRDVKCDFSIVGEKLTKKNFATFLYFLYLEFSLLWKNDTKQSVWYSIWTFKFFFFGHRLFVRRTGQAIINMIPLSLAILEILPFFYFFMNFLPILCKMTQCELLISSRKFRNSWHVPFISFEACSGFYENNWYRNQRPYIISYMHFKECYRDMINVNDIPYNCPY